MAGAGFAPGPNRSKVLDLDGYGVCNRNDQVSINCSHFPANLNTSVQSLHSVSAYRWGLSITVFGITIKLLFSSLICKHSFLHCSNY